MDDMEFDTILSVRDIDESTDADAILELLSRLPMNEQRVFNLFAIDGYSHKEISAILKIPEGTSKWLLSTARKKMADSLIKIVRKGFALVV
jgi:RNA polymerase sigma-70 factor (ECF subfamily)